MEILIRTFRVICCFVFLILAAGCAGSASEDLLPTQTTDPHHLSDEPYTVTFDGSACSAAGPNELPSGDHSFILYNTSDLDVKVEVARFQQDKTIKDLLDIQKEPGNWWPKPSWLEHATAKGSAWTGDDGGKVWTYKTYLPADYVIYVIIFEYGNDVSENKLWFCCQFTVEETPSE